MIFIITSRKLTSSLLKLCCPMWAQLHVTVRWSFHLKGPEQNRNVNRGLDKSRIRTARQKSTGPELWPWGTRASIDENAHSSSVRKRAIRVGKLGESFRKSPALVRRAAGVQEFSDGRRQRGGCCSRFRSALTFLHKKFLESVRQRRKEREIGVKSKNSPGGGEWH